MLFFILEYSEYSVVIVRQKKELKGGGAVTIWAWCVPQEKRQDQIVYHQDEQQIFVSSTDDCVVPTGQYRSHSTTTIRT